MPYDTILLYEAIRLRYASALHYYTRLFLPRSYHVPLEHLDGHVITDLLMEHNQRTVRAFYLICYLTIHDYTDPVLQQINL